MAGKNVFALSVPNAEVMEIFEDAVEEWFSETSNQWDKKTLFDAVWNRDAKVISAEMTKLLRQTISYHDYKEDFYHAFFAGIFAGAGYIVEPDKEHGEEFEENYSQVICYGISFYKKRCMVKVKETNKTKSFF